MVVGYKSVLAALLAIFAASALAQPLNTAAESGAEELALVAPSASDMGGAGSEASQGDAVTQDDIGADKWEVTFTPYLWIAGTKGEIAVPRGDGTLDIDRSFTDTLANLKFVFMGAVDVRKGRFVALTDVIYLTLGAKAEGVADPQFFEGEVDTSTFFGTAAIGYRVVDKGPLFVDLFAGGRYVSLDAEVKLTGPLQTREREAKESNFSGLVGGRVRVPVAKNMGIGLYGDIGSFLGSKDIKWQLMGSVHYEMSRHWQLMLGYRHLEIDHESADLTYDMSLSGPLLGVSYRF